jgi:CBS domain-containing protein
MGASEFEDAYDREEPSRLGEEQRLGEAILDAPIRALDPRPAVSVPESATVREAIGFMIEHGVGAVLVERGGRARAIFSERDVMRRVVMQGVPLDRPVIDVSTRDPETLGLDDGIAFALNRMVIGGFRHIPIVDASGAPLAVLSQREIVAFIVSLLPTRTLNLPPEPKHEARSEDGG